MSTFVLDLLIIFGLNLFSTCMGNLKTSFLAQKTIKPVYLITFIDALVFVYAFKLIATSSGYGYILAFALGRLSGVFLANIIEKKLAFGLLEIDVYKHPEEGKILADNLREQGYSVTTTLGYGVGGKERLVLTAILPRKQFPEFHAIMEQDGKVNMSVKSITKTYGKVGSINVLAE
ncbi:hypothetical protein [Syntrophomonas wolfei]|uniref:DUF5698 domain-containing protein n=1 Tax=Syntrophomonas wolfei subsp. wolfei (strain DSM 2245B / Goettingen) TaxID=335541 RepID=Q0AW09_SYNWW|nr:hypothetical protein [Syntrophomonas wolfei]ABI69095.1 hypothetical protein Swol_1797 [Syntrophomonas wolfei subsp. wolfei str. Goettingen G311]